VGIALFAISKICGKRGISTAFGAGCEFRVSAEPYTLRGLLRYPVFSLLDITLVVCLRSCCALTSARAWPIDYKVVSEMISAYPNAAKRRLR
jgi:hypothetical protein